MYLYYVIAKDVAEVRPLFFAIIVANDHADLLRFIPTDYVIESVQQLMLLYGFFYPQGILGSGFKGDFYGENQL